MANRRGRYGDGTLYQRGRTWWLKYRAGGRWHYESSGSPDKAVAQTLLDTRREQRASGAPVQPRLDRVTYAEAATALRTHYEVTGSRDLAKVTPRLARLQAFLRGDRLVAVSTARCEAYAAQRQGQASNATINRELAVLGRMLRLAFEHAALARVPKIRKLTEAAPRAGFVEDAQFAAIRRGSPRSSRPQSRSRSPMAGDGMRSLRSPATRWTSRPARSGSTWAPPRTTTGERWT